MAFLNWLMFAVSGVIAISNAHAGNTVSATIAGFVAGLWGNDVLTPLVRAIVRRTL